MKAFIDDAIRFCLLFAIGCGIFASADDSLKNGGRASPPDQEKTTHERLTFLNFSDKLVELYYVDKSQGMHLEKEVHPYQSYTVKTFSGHTFSYKWRGSNLSTIVDQTTEMHVDQTGDPRAVDTTSLVAQVHILGGMDQPETKKVVCGTTRGDIRINVKPFWSPRGATRFLELAHKDLQYFDGCAINRVVPEFLTQFGIGADYAKRTKFRINKDIPDDPPLDPPIPFRPGYMSYAGRGPDSRSSEVFIVMPDTPQKQLDYFGGGNTWETPFGYVEKEDLNIVASWYSYGDMTPFGDGPDPQLIYEEDGYEYLKKDFPKMDYIRGCAIVPDDDLNDPSIATLSYDGLAKYLLKLDEDEL